MLDSWRGCAPRTVSPAEGCPCIVFGAYPGTPPRSGLLPLTCAWRLPVLHARSFQLQCFLPSAAQRDTAAPYRARSPHAAASPARETSFEERPPIAQSPFHASCTALIPRTTALDSRSHC